MKYEKTHRYIEQLLGTGELLFSKKKMKSALKHSEDSARSVIKRLVADERIIRLSHGWYIALPSEYRSQGFVPPELFIDDYMNAINQKYYVCLLSAATFYGATHQSTQIFQVMVEKTIKPISHGALNIQFYVNKEINKVSTNTLKTDRGPLIISSPEVTAIDLLKYVRQSGNLNHIATVLGELSDNIDPDILQKKLDYAPLLSIQRLGFLLEILGVLDLSTLLEEYLKFKRKPKFYSLLNPAGTNLKHLKSKKWHLIINEEIETDTET